MAGKISVGSVSVSIVPSAEGFVEKVRAVVDEAPSEVRINVKLDGVPEAEGELAALDAEAKKTGDSAGGAGSGISLMAGGIAAALPLLPELAGGLLAVSGAVFAAGSGLASFGAIALTDITNATNATQQLQAAQLAVQNATSNSARADALTKEQALITSLGPSTIQLGQAINDLSGIWKAFAEGFNPEITRDVTQFATILTTAFPLIQPLITAGAGAVSTILTNLNTALQSPAAQQFFAWLAGAAEQDILGLTKAFGGFGVGILDIFQAFAPLETLVVNGLAGMGTAFADWASHLAASQGFQQFLAYVAQNGPLLTKTLGDIGLDVGKILAALTPLLPPLLQVVDFLTKVIGYGNVPDILVAIALGFTAIKLAATVGGWLETFGSSINDVVVKLGLMRAAEVTAGGTVDVAPAVTSLGTVGGAADAATLSVKGLLGALGTLTAAVFVVKIAMEIDSKQSNHVSAVPDKGFWGQLVNAGNVVPDWISSMLTPKKSAPGPTIGQAPTVDNPAWDLAVGIDSSAADLQNTFNSQVSGSPTSYFGNVGAAGGAPGGGTNNPPAYSIPNTATGAQNAAATAAANNAAGLAALLGLNLMQSLAQGITTGTNPLTQAFTNINQKLTGPAQTLGTALQTIFTNALALGQQAAQSLAFSVTSAPTVGSYTSVYMDAQGRSTTTTQSPLVGSAFNALITDQKFVADLQKAAAMGLAPSLRAQFVAAGPSSFPTLDALVNSGQGAVSTLNSENAAITALGNSYGLQVAQQQFGPQTLTTLQQIRDQQAQLPAAIGTSVAAALNHTGATAKVAAANTANKGVFARAQ